VLDNGLERCRVSPDKCNRHRRCHWDIRRLVIIIIIIVVMSGQGRMRR
jgi:hypothetical protein